MGQKNNPENKDFGMLHHYWVEYGVLARLRKHEILVYLAILRFADYKTRRSDVSISIISQLTRVSQPKIGKITDKLANLGMIRKEWDVYKKKLRKNYYFILIPKDYKPLYNPKGYTAPNQDSIDDNNTTPNQVSIEGKDTAPIHPNILPRFDGKYCPESGQTFREVREVKEGSALALAESQASPSPKTQEDSKSVLVMENPKTDPLETEEGSNGKWVAEFVSLAKQKGISEAERVFMERGKTTSDLYNAKIEWHMANEK